jgi:glycosyltransferase involved in cell wall biosynthesis
MSNPGMSIVIPAFNEEKFLPATLNSISTAICRLHARLNVRTEIIVVNNNSTDGTVDVARRFGARIIEHSQRNIASVRNAGIRAALYDLVVTVDADNFIPAHAFCDIWLSMQTGRYVGGGVRVVLNTERTILKVVIFSIDRLLLHGLGVSAGMFFFWKSAAERIRGFPEEFLVGEDTVFALLLRRDARKHGLKYCNLSSVRLLTADRKEVSFVGIAKTLWHVSRQLLGRKVTRDQLRFWYFPDR